MKCDSPYSITPRGYLQTIDIPCGACPNCRLRRVDDWVLRLTEEDKVQKYSHFVTLTYDNDHVPLTKNGFPTLCKRDLQLFWKRLRKINPNQVRYYATGEYGSRTHRPHYHAIVFGVPAPELFFKAWPLGSVHVGKVSGDSIAYTLKYISKNDFVKRHKRDDRAYPFAAMSKSLGNSFLSSVRVRHLRDHSDKLYTVRPGGYKKALPRYYREKVWNEAERKAQTARIIASIKEQSERDRREALTTMTEEEYLEQIDSGRFERYRRFHHSQKKRKL